MRELTWEEALELARRQARIKGVTATEEQIRDLAFVLKAYNRVKDKDEDNTGRQERY